MGKDEKFSDPPDAMDAPPTPYKPGDTIVAPRGVLEDFRDRLRREAEEAEAEDARNNLENPTIAPPQLLEDPADTSSSSATAPMPVPRFASSLESVAPASDPNPGRSPRAVFIPPKKTLPRRLASALWLTTAAALTTGGGMGAYYWATNLSKGGETPKEPVAPAVISDPIPETSPDSPKKMDPLKPPIFYAECNEEGKPVSGEFRYSAHQEQVFTWAKNEAGEELWGIQPEGFQPFNPDVWVLCESRPVNPVEILLIPSEH